MKRHVIAGHFGSGDRFNIITATDETLTRLNLLSSERRLDYGIDSALSALAKLGVLPSEIGNDLLILAAHVHAADTRISRRKDSQDTWTREIRIVVPVSNPDRWATNAELLQKTLGFLTGDRWIIGFRPRPQGFAALTPLRPKKAPENPKYGNVSLFSGGLDSLIGAIDLVEQGMTPLFASHAGEGATSGAQRDCFALLEKHYDKLSLDRLRVWMSFPKNLVRGSDSENTTRGRSFLFFAIGVFAGTGLKRAFKLFVPENGLIALNVPLDLLRLGSLSTRTTHPFYIARWNELLSRLGIEGKIENSYWNKTKGEMVSNCANKALLRKLIPASISCSSPSKGRWSGHGIEHCGYCLPCIIRRAALLKGLDGQSDPTTYTIANLSTRALNANESEGQQVRSFQFAIERLQARSDLAKLLIHKPGSLKDESFERQNALAQVYRRGMSEVAALLAKVRTRSV